MHLLEDRALDQEPAARRAHLAGVAEGGAHRGGRRGVEVGVVEDDVRALAAELQGEALGRRRRGAHHQAADLGRAGEADVLHVGVADQRRADLAVPGEHVDDARRDARLLADRGDPQHRHRRLLGRLHHHRAAGGERRGELEGAGHDREVPGQDEGGDADRLAPGVDVVAGDRDRLALDPGRRAAEVAEGAGAHRGVGTGALDRLAVVAGLEHGEVLEALLDQLGHPDQDARAVFWGKIAPATVSVGGRRGGDGGVDIGGGGLDRAGEGLAVGRVDARRSARARRARATRRRSGRARLREKRSPSRWILHCQ